MNNLLKSDIDVLQRKLKSLRDALHRTKVSKGQEKFLLPYLEIVDEFLGKSFDILNAETYKEQLIQLDE